MLLLVMFASLVLLMSWGADVTSASGVALILFLGASFAFLLRQTGRREHIPSLTILVVFIAAYCPSALKWIEQGFWRPLQASKDAVSLALLALLAFLAIAVGTARVVARIFERPAKAVEYIATAGRPELGAIGVSCAVAIAMIAAFRTGLWSHYAEMVKLQRGGIRLELLYYPFLFGFSAAIGRVALKEVIGEKINTFKATVWTSLWVGSIVFLFITQSRRMMVGALVLAIASATLESEHISKVRAGLAAVALLVLQGLLLVGSFLWRQQGPTKDAFEQILTISDRSVDFDAAAQSFSQRLTYLWIDSTSIDHFDVLSERYDLWDAFSSHIIKATPGLLLPDKYLTNKIVCEDVYESLGLHIDLPCTPITEGLLFGGIGGLVVTGAIFGFALGIITAIFRQGSFTSTAIAAITMMTLVLIECSAFPIIDASRSFAFILTMSASIAWLLRLGYELLGKRTKARQPALLPRSNAAS